MLKRVVARMSVMPGLEALMQSLMSRALRSRVFYRAAMSLFDRSESLVTSARALTWPNN